MCASLGGSGAAPHGDGTGNTVGGGVAAATEDGAACASGGGAATPHGDTVGRAVAYFLEGSAAAAFEAFVLVMNVPKWIAAAVRRPVSACLLGLFVFIPALTADISFEVASWMLKMDPNSGELDCSPSVAGLSVTLGRASGTRIPRASWAAFKGFEYSLRSSFGLMTSRTTRWIASPRKR